MQFIQQGLILLGHKLQRMKFIQRIIRFKLIKVIQHFIVLIIRKLIMNYRIMFMKWNQPTHLALQQLIIKHHSKLSFQLIKLHSKLNFGFISSQVSFHCC